SLLRSTAHAADPLGSLTPAEVPLIEAEKLSEQAGPPHSTRVAAAQWWRSMGARPGSSHNHLNRADESFESVDRDQSIRAILGVGPEFQYEILSKEDWVGRRVVADRSGRVFICGDAAQLWMPYAGYGMNAGIADAANLAWLLGAVFDGWAFPAILDASAAERQPITEQVSHLAMYMALKVLGQRRSVPPEIETPGREGDSVRAR